MSILDTIIIAIGLAMDAFAVSISGGLSISPLRLRDTLKFGVYFGFFQMLMPLIGWAAGCLFSSYVMAFDHWIAFFLLGYIGLKMILEAAKGEGDFVTGTGFRIMVLLSLATSIDALATGITFAFTEVNIWLSIGIIGTITFVLSFFGALLGKHVGKALGKWAQFAGGGLLIAMGIKILIEHLFRG